MTPTPPSIHFPSPYARPSVPPTVARFVETPDGARIASFVYGRLVSDGLSENGSSPVLFIHGNGEEHGIFGAIIDAVLDAGHAAVALDSRAQGKSTRGTARLTYELMAEDALCVMDALGVPRAHVLGFSDGGIEGLLLARDHKDRVASLTCLGANLTPEGVIEEPDWDVAGSIARNAAWAAADWPGQVDPSLLFPTPDEAAQIAELLQLMEDEPHIEAASLGAISCPVTVMAGEFDCIVPEQTRLIAASIPNAQLVIVPGADHNLPKRAADAVIEGLLATIARV